jgi:hypothetical protein
LQDSSAGAAAAAGKHGQQQQDMLTHGGVSLEELEELNARPTELLGDLDDDLLEDLVQQYHFGGGEEEQEGGEGGQAGGQRKTKKQVRRCAQWGWGTENIRAQRTCTTCSRSSSQQEHVLVLEMHLCRWQLLHWVELKLTELQQQSWQPVAASFLFLHVVCCKL